MPGFIDARCPNCDAKIGWMGRMVDRPDCRKCGHRPPQSELEAADSKMDELERKMLADPTNDYRQRRVCAGLTLRDAAVKIGVSASVLSGWENRGEQPTPEQLSRMDEAYGMGKFDGSD